MWNWRAPIAFAAAFLAIGCETSTPAARPPATVASPSPAATSPPSVATAEPANAGITVSGPIIVEHQLELVAQRDGVVQKIYVDAPQHVKAGTLMATLDDRQIAASLEAARAKTRSIAADLKNWEAEAEVLEADYLRAQRLSNLGLISDEQLQHAKYKAESDHWDIKRVSETLNTAQHEERSLELELEKTKIRAPFDGLIARRYLREGQNVAKGERLFWVTAESPLLMRFTLPEQYFGRLRQGQQLPVAPGDLPGEMHTSRIKEISPVIDPSSGTFEVLIELTGNRGSLRPGMTAVVRFEKPRSSEP